MSIAFERIALRLTRADRPRLEQKSKKGGQFFRVLGWVLIIFFSLIILFVFIGMTTFDTIWFGASAMGMLVIGGIYRIFFGPAGLAGDGYEEHRVVAVLFSEIGTMLREMDKNERVLLFGVGNIGPGKLTLSCGPEGLTFDLVRFSAITETGRIPMGDYTYLGAARVVDGGTPDISHEDLQGQPWMKAARAEGKRESEIRAFVHGLKRPA